MNFVEKYEMMTRVRSNLFRFILVEIEYLVYIFGI